MTPDSPRMTRPKDISPMKLEAAGLVCRGNRRNRSLSQGLLGGVDSEASKDDAVRALDSPRRLIMTLQDFASLAATISSAGTLVTIIIFSIQTRHNTRAVRASTFQQ